MLSLWVGVYALEVSPRLHEFFHPGAQNPGHNCLVTQLQHHGVLSGFVAAAAPAVSVMWGIPDCPCVSQFLPASDYRLSLSRAPPSV
jgi:hypothetical protein